MVSNRTRLSLCQFLSLQDHAFVSILFEKHGINQLNVELNPNRNLLLHVIRDRVMAADQASLVGLLIEISGTTEDLFNRIPRQLNEGFGGRLRDLENCLLLDGYRIEQGRLVEMDPEPGGMPLLEDEAIAAIRDRTLPDSEEIIRLLSNSAEDFTRQPPDYNGCLVNARAALQTLATSIATAIWRQRGGDLNPRRWGSVIGYLRVSGTIPPAVEEGLTGVFTLLSDGAHVPIRLTEADRTRLGRRLALTMCLFLAKLP
jgi:hypothetical protein